LEGRLLAILDNRRRTALRRSTRLLAVSFSALVVLAVSGFRPVPRATPQLAVMRAAIATTISTASSDAVVTATAAVATTTSAVARADTTFEKSVDVRSGETLTIDLNPTGGAVTIVGWDEPRVRVRGTLAGRNWRENDPPLVTAHDIGEGNLFILPQIQRGGVGWIHQNGIPRRAVDRIHFRINQCIELLPAPRRNSKQQVCIRCPISEMRLRLF